jgi:hypothetical protein
MPRAPSCIASSSLLPPVVPLSPRLGHSIYRCRTATGPLARTCSEEGFPCRSLIRSSGAHRAWHSWSMSGVEGAAHSSASGGDRPFARGELSAARSCSCLCRPPVGHRIMGLQRALRRSVSKLSEPLLPPQSSERYSARAPTPRRLPHVLQAGIPQLSRRHPIGTRRNIRPKFDQRNRARRYGSVPLP